MTNNLDIAYHLERILEWYYDDAEDSDGHMIPMDILAVINAMSLLFAIKRVYARNQGFSLKGISPSQDGEINVYLFVAPWINITFISKKDGRMTWHVFFKGVKTSTGIFDEQSPEDLIERLVKND